jgi:hypothetical protein
LLKGIVMRKLILPFLLAVCCFILFTGQKSDDSPAWNNNPSTVILATGVYPSLPPLVMDVPRIPTKIIRTPYEVLVINPNPNIRVLPTTSTTQTEVPLVCSRANQNLMFGSSNAVTGSTINSGSYITTNGGLNWFGQEYINNGNTNNQRGDPGPAYGMNSRLIFTHLSSNTNFGGVTGMAAEYSTNYGQTFSASYQVHTNSLDDKNLAGADDYPTSPYFGNFYMAFCDYSAGPSFCARTTNGGVTWETPVSWAPPSGLYSQGHDVDACPNGTVIVCYALHGSSSPWTETGVGIGRSTNGGVSFTPQQPAYATNGTRSTSFNGWGIRTNGFPRLSIDKSGGARNGWIYIVMSEYNLAPAGSDADVVLHRSTDNGLTWSAGVRVNQDPINNGKVQFFPCVRVDEYGGVNVAYYDNRDFPSSGDSCSVWLSRSIDGGTTWTDMEIADHHFKPKPCTGLSGGYMGDYIGVTSGNNKVWAFWTDDKAGAAGFFNAWAGYISLGPSISHIPLTNTENLTGPYVVNCVITPAGSNIDPTKTRLLWSRNNPTITDSVLMTNTSGNNWTANIPGNGNPAIYRYYLKTADLLNRTATAPAGAPAVLYSFTATADTVKPVITHTPLGDVPKTSWPATVAATVTDNIGIDSVWVRWYKNNTSTGLKTFKLINTGGSNFAAAFNSDTSQVAYNDSIFYRIIAQDNSSGHNKDSTALYHFKIIAIVTACIGTGTTQVGYPYYTFYMDSRTLMLYTVSDILSNGGAPGNITRIGFNVALAASQIMNGFQIKMQHTTATSVTGFINTGWTTVYSGTYSVPGTGWQYVNLQTPFQWNGTQNLLVEVCFDNTSYTSNTNVNSTAATGMTWHYHIDNSTGCSLTGGSLQTTRPNICMTINLLVGNESQQSTVPMVYSLQQNYPNPFNPSTSIRFNIPKLSHAKLVVYDVVGREVAVLVNEMKQPGSYEAVFNAENFASGVYFYRLDAGDFTDVKKMVLVK